MSLQVALAHTYISFHETLDIKVNEKNIFKMSPICNLVTADTLLLR